VLAAVEALIVAAVDVAVHAADVADRPVFTYASGKKVFAQYGCVSGPRKAMRS